MSVIVFGSINMDLVVRVPQFPKPGETLTGSSFQTTPGGKGANQAVACARLAIPTTMVGKVGQDEFGQTLKDHLSSMGVNTSAVVVDPDQRSGVALIAINDHAENNIIIIPGANGAVGAAELDQLDRVLEGARLLLLQLEVPMPAVVEAARRARQRGVQVMLDPAPVQALPKELYENIDYLTPNQGEASSLVDIPIRTEKDALLACQMLLERGAQNVIIKMGEQGVYVASPSSCTHYPAIPVKAIDTVAAGDAFNGALAAGLDEGLPLEEAIQWGLAGGAWAVTKPGAQAAMPNRAELFSLLRK